MANVCIALGANVGNRRVNLQRAVALLGRHVVVERCSPLYESAPVGVTDQPAFLNAVLLARTELEPEPLLDALQAIERSIGRRPSRRWGPRPIDLDMLTYDERRIDTARLTVPHPRIAERGFVLRPLADLDPARVLPGQTDTVRDLLARVDSGDLVRVAGPDWAG